MRYLAVLACLLSLPALAYDVTALMPPTNGAAACQLVLDGNPVGGERTCGTAQIYPDLITADGVYEFAYRAVNAGGQSALSPVATLTITTTLPPDDPTEPPQIVSVECTDQLGNPVTCPAGIAITITP